MLKRSALEWGRKISWMKWLPVVAVAVLAMGCEDDDHFVSPRVDLTPPAIPNGVYSITADDQIILRWNPNREADLDGYHILSNVDGSSTYEIIATIDAFGSLWERTGRNPGNGKLRQAT